MPQTPDNVGGSAAPQGAADLDCRQRRGFRNEPILSHMLSSQELKQSNLDIKYKNTSIFLFLRRPSLQMPDNACFAPVRSGSADSPETLALPERQQYDALPREQQRAVCINHDVGEFFENFESDLPKGGRAKCAKYHFA